MIRSFLDASSGHLSTDTWSWLETNLADNVISNPANNTAASHPAPRLPRLARRYIRRTPPAPAGQPQHGVKGSEKRGGRPTASAPGRRKGHAA
jgi:hypothetical protein